MNPDGYRGLDFRELHRLISHKAPRAKQQRSCAAPATPATLRSSGDVLVRVLKRTRADLTYLPATAHFSAGGKRATGPSCLCRSGRRSAEAASTCGLLYRGLAVLIHDDTADKSSRAVARSALPHLVPTCHQRW